MTLWDVSFVSSWLSLNTKPLLETSEQNKEEIIMGKGQQEIVWTCHKRSDSHYNGDVPFSSPLIAWEEWSVSLMLWERLTPLRFGCLWGSYAIFLIREIDFWQDKFNDADVLIGVKRAMILTNLTRKGSETAVSINPLSKNWLFLPYRI